LNKKMSTVSGDYNNFSAGSSSCAYAPLGNYNNNYSMGVAPQGRMSSGSYIVPAWGAIGYDSLTSQVPNCSGYYNIMSAYGADAGSCQTTYRTSMCGAEVAPAPAPEGGNGGGAPSMMRRR
jgi:hypothetical protein